MIDKRDFYINGAWVVPIDGTDFPVLNPATEEAYAVISLGGSADAEAAIMAARAAFPAWSATTPEMRGDVLKRILVGYEARTEDMAKAMAKAVARAKAKAKGHGQGHGQGCGQGQGHGQGHGRHGHDQSEGPSHGHVAYFPQ